MSAPALTPSPANSASSRSASRRSAVPRSGASSPRVARFAGVWWTRWSLILLCLTVVSALSRLIMLNRPTDAHTPVFDEKHYVPQSWQIARSWEHPLTGGIEDNPGYGLVVHPPLAKQLEAMGMMVFGYTPWGWRIVSALCAIAVILLIAMIARRLSGSDFVGLAAGIIAVCDGILFVTGRSGMLDHVQTLCVCSAAYFFVRDYEQVQARFVRVWREGRLWHSPLGPRMGYRWWRFAAGVALGCALSVKWSGLYYMAFVGIAITLVDYVRRRHFGITRPFRGAVALDAVPAFFSVVILPIGVYLLSWRAWFASETGVFRHAVESGRYSETQGWFWSFLPETMQNFIYYHQSVLSFHTSLTNSNGHYHSWESKPWSWLVSSRSLMYYNPSSEGGVHKVVLLVGTPAVWWFCVPVMVWALWCLIIHRDVRWTVPVVGFAAGFFPWLADLDRQMYLFYALNLAPFLIIALALTAGQVLNWRIPQPASRPGVRQYRGPRLMRQYAGPIVVVAYLVLVVWNFLFFLPIYTAMPLSDVEFYSRMWLPSWR